MNPQEFQTFLTRLGELWARGPTRSPSSRRASPRCRSVNQFTAAFVDRARFGADPAGVIGAAGQVRSLIDAVEPTDRRLSRPPLTLSLPGVAAARASDVHPEAWRMAETIVGGRRLVYGTGAFATEAEFMRTLAQAALIAEHLYQGVVRGAVFSAGLKAPMIDMLHEPRAGFSGPPKAGVHWIPVQRTPAPGPAPVPASLAALGANATLGEALKILPRRGGSMPQPSAPAADEAGAVRKDTRAAAEHGPAPAATSAASTSAVSRTGTGGVASRIGTGLGIGLSGAVAAVLARWLADRPKPAPDGDAAAGVPDGQDAGRGAGGRTQGRPGRTVKGPSP